MQYKCHCIPITTLTQSPGIVYLFSPGQFNFMTQPTWKDSLFLTVRTVYELPCPVSREGTEGIDGETIKIE